MNKKEILIISFFFQPFNTIGAVRVSAWVKYLQDRGYVVHVVTAKRNRNLNLSIAKNINIHYVKWPNADRLLNLSEKYPRCRLLWFLARLANRLAIPSATTLPEGGIAVWRFFALRKAKQIIKNNNIGLIYTSSGPVSSAIIGSKLAKKFNLPWIPEFRDLWAKNVYVKSNKFNLKREKKVLAHSSQIVAINKMLKIELEGVHGKPVKVVYNGFVYKNELPVSKNKKLVISYLGTIIPEKRDPSVLFQAIGGLFKEGKISSHDLIVNFYGYGSTYLKSLIRKYNLDDIIKNKGYVSFKESIEIQKNSNILLLLSWNNRLDQATPGKLFEYIGMKKPILAICYPGEIKEILDKTGTGIIINDVDKMKEFLLYAIKNYKTDPNLGFTFNEKEISKFSREYQYRELEQIVLKYL